MDLDRVSDRVVDWHEAVTNDDVLEYAYDSSIQNIFWIYPKPSNIVNKKIELIYQKHIRSNRNNRHIPSK